MSQVAAYSKMETKENHSIIYIIIVKLRAMVGTTTPDVACVSLWWGLPRMITLGQ